MTNSVSALLPWPATVPADLAGVQNTLQTITRIRLNDAVLWQALTNQTANLSNNVGSNYAPLASPVFTGTPEAPTASAGNDSTELATTSYVDNNALGGLAQTYTNATSSRALATSYTNSTGRPIFVAAQINYGSSQFSVTVGGVGVNSGYFSSGQAPFITFVVPAGDTYSISNTGGSISTWFELR